MVWYQYLKRTQPYLKNYRRWNLWYDYNNPKHQEIKRTKILWLEYALRRMFKHEAHTRYFLVFVGIPLFFWMLNTKKRFAKPVQPEPGKYK
jgi:hypothetical protein